MKYVFQSRGFQFQKFPLPVGSNHGGASFRHYIEVKLPLSWPLHLLLLAAAPVSVGPVISLYVLLHK